MALTKVHNRMISGPTINVVDFGAGANANDLMFTIIYPTS